MLIQFGFQENEDIAAERNPFIIGRTQPAESGPLALPVVADPGSGNRSGARLAEYTRRFSVGVNHRGGSKRPKVRNVMARLILSSCLGLVLLGSVSAIAEPSQAPI